MGWVTIFDADGKPHVVHTSAFNTQPTFEIEAMKRAMNSQTPFGTMTDQNADKAPTNAEVLANPGKYDGTAFDPFAWPVGGIPLIQMYFSSEDAEGQKLYVPRTWGEWLKSDPEAALAYCLVVKGGPINLRALSAGQLAKLK